MANPANIGEYLKRNQRLLYPLDEEIEKYMRGCVQDFEMREKRNQAYWYFKSVLEMDDYLKSIHI